MEAPYAIEEYIQLCEEVHWRIWEGAENVHTMHLRKFTICFFSVPPFFVMDLDLI